MPAPSRLTLSLLPGLLSVLPLLSACGDKVDDGGDTAAGVVDASDGADGGDGSDGGDAADGADGTDGTDGTASALTYLTSSIVIVYGLLIYLLLLRYCAGCKMFVVKKTLAKSISGFTHPHTRSANDCNDSVTVASHDTRFSLISGSLSQSHMIVHARMVSPSLHALVINPRALLILPLIVSTLDP